MWKPMLLVSVMSLALLAGCNSNNDKLNEETPMQDVENGVNDAMRDTRDAVDDTMDAIDPNIKNHNDGTLNNGNGTLVPEVDNGTMAPGAPPVNQDGIIENSKEKKVE